MLSSIGKITSTLLSKVLYFRPSSDLSLETPSRRNSEIRSEISSILGPEKELVLTEKMHHIVSNFRNRAVSVRQKLEQAASPEIEDDLDDDDEDNDTILEGHPGSQSLNESRLAVMDDTPTDNKGLLEKLME